MKHHDSFRTDTVDSTEDFGPRFRGGPFALFIALFGAFSAGGIGMILWNEGYRLAAGTIALLLGGVALWACWMVIMRLRDRTPRRSSHAVLADVLGFEILCTCRDVAATTFLAPDNLQLGARTTLLIFVENYASRRRVAHLDIGPHQALGLGERQYVSLELAAGQAAVFSLPLTVTANASPGEHDLPITLQVERPNGTGLRLRASHRHLHDIWKMHFAVPFTLVPQTGAAPDAVRSTGEPRFIGLASLSGAAPTRDQLGKLLQENLAPTVG
ncbi:hypothetical protein [Oleiharenicola sp. Vm1]|jgi:hypothetical protein|uniref:hypothetical protein n=1 Tax=Oleiharenicola sp. Vm1 TaxID=3398393 RepID=UPI0039F4B20C